MKKKIFCLSAAVLIFLFSSLNQSFGQWLQTSGPAGGNVYQISFNSTNDAFIATYGGVFARLAGSTSWTLASNGLTTNDIRALITINDVLWAGCYEVSGSPGGVFISSDKGASWTAVNSGLTNRTIISLGNNTSAVFAGTNGAGIYRTTNSGTNWTAVNSGLSGLTLIINTIYTFGTTIYAGTNEGLAVSTNNGSNWTIGLAGLPNAASKRIFGVTIQSGALYIGTANGVYKSTDGGANFTSVTNDLTSPTINNMVSDANYLFVATQGGGVFRSSNSGANWTAFNNLLPNYITSTIKIAGNLVYCGTQGDGVFYSLSSAAGWINVSGLINTTPRCLMQMGSSIYAGLFVKGISVTNNSGSNWTYNNTGLSSLIVNYLANDGTNIYAATGSGAYKSANAGANWTNIGSTFGTTSYLQSITKVGSVIYAGTTNDGVYISTNEGANWTAFNSGIAAGSSIWGFVNDASFIYAAAGVNGVYKLPVGGSTWTSVNTGITGGDIREIFMSGTAIIAGYSGLYITTDGGGNWVSIANGPIAGKSVRSIAALDNGSKILVGTFNFGIYVSTNSGTDFTAANTGYPSLSEVGAMCIVNTDVFTGLTGNGVWKRPLSEMIVGIKNISTQIPSGYSLEQNYPNPFNPETNIRFALPKNGKTTLSVYDITGREIAVLVNGMLNAGTYEYNFSAKNLTSGIYLYKIVSNEFTSVRKMMLVR